MSLIPHVLTLTVLHRPWSIAPLRKRAELSRALSNISCLLPTRPETVVRLTGMHLMLFVESTGTHFLLINTRWKLLEGGLAAMGSQADTIVECIEDEEDSGRAKPIDVEYLLANVVPSILTLSGRYRGLSFYIYTNAHFPRFPILTRQRLCFRQSVRQNASRPIGWTIPGRSDSSHRS